MALLGLVALILGGGGWVAHERLASPKVEARRFTDRELFDEARHVRVVIYSATSSPSWDAARSFLRNSSVPFEERDIDKDTGARDQWLALNPEKTLPVFDIEGEVVVGGELQPVTRALLAAAELHLVAIRTPDCFNCE